MCRHRFTLKIVVYSYGVYSKENRKVNDCNAQTTTPIEGEEKGKHT